MRWIRVSTSHSSLPSPSMDQPMDDATIADDTSPGAPVRDMNSGSSTNARRQQPGFLGVTAGGSVLGSTQNRRLQSPTLLEQPACAGSRCLLHTVRYATWVNTTFLTDGQLDIRPSLLTRLYRCRRVCRSPDNSTRTVTISHCFRGAGK